MTATFEVHPETIKEYVEYLNTVKTNLESLKTTLNEAFAEAAASATGLPIGEKAKELYDIPAKIELIDETITKIDDYRDWLDATNTRKVEEDKERANEYGDGALPPASSETPEGGSQTGTGSPSYTGGSSSGDSSVSGGGVSPDTVVPQVTTPEGLTGNGNGNGNDPSSTGGTGAGSHQPGTGLDTGIDTSGLGGGSQTGSGWDPSSFSPSGNGNGTAGGGSFGQDNNYGTSGHSIGGSLANGTTGGAFGSGSGNSGFSNGSGGAAGLAALGEGLDGEGTGKSGKSLLDNINELTAGSALNGLFKNGLGANGNRLLGGNGGLGGSSGDALGTIAKAGIAIGIAGAGAGAYAAARTKYYIFTEEDWESIVPSDRDLIIDKFLKVEFLDAEIETFRTSTFKIKADILDDPAKKIEKAYKQNSNIREEIIEKYAIDIFRGNQTVDRYLLFILMIIDGHSTISEYNIEVLLNDYLEEEMDLLYSGLQMEDYIYEEGEVQAPPEEAEIY